MASPSYAMPTQAQYNEIAAAAQKNGVSLPLELALANDESHFDQSSVSSQGAVGIFQLMPDAASDVGLAPGAQYNEQQNIIGGSAYLKKMLDAFGGNEATALTAYNAGIGNVKTLGAAAASQLPNADPDYAAKIQTGAAYYAKAYNLATTTQSDGVASAIANALGGMSTVNGEDPATGSSDNESAAKQKQDAQYYAGVAGWQSQILTVGIILILIGGGIFLMAPKQEMADAAVAA